MAQETNASRGPLSGLRVIEFVSIGPGPAHHWAIGVGHVGSKIDKVAALLNMESVRVC
jgi:L-arabinose isomerase